MNAAITATFSEPMDASTVTAATFSLNNGATGAGTYSGTTATFTPSSNLAYSTTYTATITTGVKDAAGNAMASPYTWTFTTGAVPDTTPPTVTSTSPVNSDTGVAVNAVIIATFSEPMDATTVTPSTFTLNNGVTGTVTYSGTTATFTPSNNLASSTTYMATITTCVKDVAGNTMASNYSWTFTTGAVPGVTSKLNDTGITANQCYEAGGNIVACNSSGALALNNAQDGMVGRDVDGATNGNVDGKLGFSFTPVAPSAGGCVLDNVTGLMWEVKTTDGGLRDSSNTYSNLGNGSSNDTSGFVAAVNASNLCGHSDWRLPSADELQSLVYYSVVSGTAIDTNWFPNTQRIYWSSSLNASGAWYVDFSWGDVSLYFPNTAYSVRLVRAGWSQVTPRYTVSTDGQEVTDNQTSLIWHRCSEGMIWNGTTCAGTASTYTHEQALQLAAAQASSTGKAWRLPNVKELASIVDRSLSNPAIDSTAFPATPSSLQQLSYYWSSSPFFGYGVTTGLAWSADFTGSGVIFINRSLSPLYVRLVRAGQ